MYQLRAHPRSPSSRPLRPLGVRNRLMSPQSTEVDLALVRNGGEAAGTMESDTQQPRIRVGWSVDAGFQPQWLSFRRSTDWCRCFWCFEDLASHHGYRHGRHPHRKTVQRARVRCCNIQNSTVGRERRDLPRSLGCFCPISR